MIKTYRNRKGYTQEYVARKLDISLRYYQNVEKYESLPNVITAIKLSELLEAKITDLWIKYL